MRLLAASLAALALFSSDSLVHASAGAPPTARPGSEYETRASLWLARHGFDPDAPPTLEKLLDEGFVHVSVGLYEVLVPPKSLADAAWLDPIRSSLQALLDTQLEWVDWLPADGKIGARPGKLSSDAKTLAKWIGSWKASRFDADAIAGASGLDATSAKAKEREASERFEAFMRTGGPVGPPGGDDAGETPRATKRLILAPSRADFVELLAAVGLVELRHRPYFWVPDGATWTEFDFDGIRVIALEFGGLDAASDYTSSISMTAKNPRAIEQQVAQIGARELLGTAFGGTVDPALVGGIANDLVISLFGEVDTRTDGDQSARVTEEVNIFIAGQGIEDGEIDNSADSRWRKNKGADYFVPLLKAAQEAAVDAADEKRLRPACFELRDFSQLEAHIVRAPFLGGSSAEAPPSQFHGDQLEFLRAYRVAFLYWLRTEAGGSAKECQRRYARFVRDVAAGTPLDRALEEIYGAPLSAASTQDLMNAKNPPLEARFVVWIQKS